MQPIKKRAKILLKAVDEAWQKLDIDKKQLELKKLDDSLAVPEIWNDPAGARKLSRQSADLEAEINPWQVLRAQLSDIDELIELGDEDLLPEFETQLSALERDFNKYRLDMLFTGEYDKRAAIIRISAGVGGLDAQDFASMLERMYLRWAESSGLKTKTIERSTNAEAGVKTSVFEVSGKFSYGKLRSENGVHRLVRLSPFNSDNLRQTSFALVEVLPKIIAPDEVKIDEKDLKIDVYRSGGHGGQSVNTTDSAVRVTHIPTGLVVAIQNERSQIQNKETALKILSSKLLQMKIEQHVETVSALRAGESANWGSQIRNYVLHPYTIVKDTRTKHEEKDTKAVLDGKIDGFIEAYLLENMNVK